MNLDINEWKGFKVGDLFDLEPTKGKDSTYLIEGNDISYIGAKKDDNGFMKRCQLDGFEEWVSNGNCIVFICLGQGSTGYSTYQLNNFIGMSGKTICGYNSNLNQYIGNFIVTVLDLERPKYSFGRSWTGERLKNTIIKLPAILNCQTNKYEPDWQFMEDYIKSLHYKPLKTINANSNIPTLNYQNWKEFLLSDYFDIVAGIYHYSEEYNEGATPYYSASNVNNGIGSYIDLEPDFQGNCIVTGKIGCSAFYAPDAFCATSDVNIYKPKFDMSKYVGLFISTIINFSENYKWAYGRQCRVGDSKKIAIRLPTTPDGTPDWQFMENYIKSLPYGDRL